ncbi:MAG TPA: Maf family protein [Acidobacteriaceae bacterium]|nr:Maf family protein [Acidobacteriaceae bacterium]
MLVLASASPRRRDLLAQAGYEFRVISADICEDLHPGEEPIPYVLRLARAKAEAVAASDEFRSLSAGAGNPPLILGADTTVVAPNGEILLKPEDDADAARMLRLLSGGTHQVITGVALVSRGTTEAGAEITGVTVRDLSEDDIAAYIASGEPQGKAGAYAIQGRFGRYVPRVEGCYFNVVGLPLARVAAMIDRARNR